LVASSDWLAHDDEPIITPPLTFKEILALQSLMPTAGSLPTTDDVKGLGFELENDAIRSYARHYLRYPRFAQLRG
jgi:hypothetical protein